MEIKTSNVAVESNEELQGKQFTIATNAKAFEILTSTLYKDVPSSIVRELISNGYDGHIRAGNTDKEIDVHAPSNCEPYFEVRDYGCSMDEETMMNIYTTFFSSTKNADNNEVGGFGLGCKLPFAYTDMFTITTYLNGKQQDYIATKEKGVPTLNKMGTSFDTEEPNGVKVSVPVQEENIDSFCQAIEYMVQYSKFKIKSNLDCEPAKEYDNLGLFDFHNYGCYDTTNRNEFVQIVRVGGVPYTLDYTTLSQGINSYLRLQEYIADKAFSGNQLVLHEALKEIGCVKNQLTIDQLLQYNGCLDFNVGELDITASRESLQYTDKTRKSLFKRLLLVQGALEKRCHEIVSKWNNNVRTMTEAMKTLNGLKQYQWGGYRDYVSPSDFIYRLGNYENKVRLDSYNYDYTVVVYSKEFVDNNDLLDGLESPKCHTLTAENSRIQHSIKTIFFNKKRDHVDIYLTNAPLKYAGIKIDKEDVELLGRYEACVAIITVSGRSNVQEQGKALQAKLDAIFPNCYRVNIIDKKNCYIPKTVRTVNRTKGNVEVEEVEEKPMTVAAKELIEQMKPISDYFGKIYLFKTNSVPSNVEKAINALEKSSGLIKSIPSLQPILDCVKVHGTARKQVEKLTDIPVVYFEDELGDELYIAEDNSLFRHDLFRQLKNELKQISFFSDAPAGEIQKLARALASYCEGKNVNCETIRKIAEFSKLNTPYIGNGDSFGFKDEGRVDKAFETIFSNFFKRFSTEDKYKMLANIFLKNSFYYPNQLFKTILSKEGLTTD